MVNHHVFCFTHLTNTSDRHGIAAPIQGVDFSYDMGPVELPPPGTKFFVTPPQLPKKPTKNYRCSCCSSNSSLTFVLGGVKEHIKHK
jgi:hypothetical protein